MRTREVIALMSFISMEMNDVIEGMKTVRVVMKDVPVLTRDVIALMSLTSMEMKDVIEEMKDFRIVRKDVRVLTRDVIAWIRLISIEMKDVHTRMSDFIAREPSKPAQSRQFAGCTSRTRICGARSNPTPPLLRSSTHLRKAGARTAARTY